MLRKRQVRKDRRPKERKMHEYENHAIINNGETLRRVCSITKMKVTWKPVLSQPTVCLCLVEI